MTVQGALNKLISKTYIMNNTCSFLGKCVKRGECEFEKCDCNECEDYKTAMKLQELVDRATPMKPHRDNGCTPLPFSYHCPKCEYELSDGGYKYDENFCPRCGQAIDGSE